MIEMRKLSDIADLTVGYVGTMGKEYCSQGVTFLRSLNIKPFGFDLSDIKYISQEFHTKLNKSALHTNDVVIVRTGVPGTCAVIPPELNGCNCADLVIVRPKLNLVDPFYLCAFINSWGRTQVSNAKVGAVQKHFNVTDAEEMLIPMISLDQQKSIGNFLCDINNIINNNISICSNLEAMAKLLYDYWFIQFDFPDENGKPYKSSGGKMVWSKELNREIPEGWEVKRLADISVAGKTQPYKERTTVPTLDLSVMCSGSIMLSELNSSENFTTNLFEMKKGDILFGSIRPYLRKAGIAPCDGAVAGTVHVFRPSDEKNYNYLAITLCNDRMFNYATKVSKGTKMPVVDLDSLMDYVIPYNKKVIEKFNNIDLRGIFTYCAQENGTLTSFRNYLLPMLINGQIKVYPPKQATN